MLPDVNFRHTAEDFRSTASNVGSMYFKKKGKKLNSATFVCHLQCVSFISVP